MQSNSTIPLICKNCGCEFRVTPSKAKYHNPKFCSNVCYVKLRITPIEDRFWSKVKKTDTCWEWTAAQDGRGYGVIHYESGVEKAHRVSWILTYGDIPKEMCVLHKCDNRICVNPAHLFLGTKADNSRDMVKKGRGMKPEQHARGDRHWSHIHPEMIRRGDQHWSHIHPEFANRGEKNGASKLSNEDVIEIRKKYKQGGANKAQLSKEYNVSWVTISRIITRKIWGHIP